MHTTYIHECACHHVTVYIMYIKGIIYAYYYKHSST